MSFFKKKFEQGQCYGFVKNLLPPPGAPYRALTPNQNEARNMPTQELLLKRRALQMEKLKMRPFKLFP